MLLIVLGTNLNAQITVSNNTKKNTVLYENVIKTVATDLKLDSVNIIISSNDFNSKMFRFEHAIATVKRVDSNTYSINVNDNNIRGWLIPSLIHEIVHIKQMHTYSLMIFKNYAVYKDEIYTVENSSYVNRAYEAEADKIAKALYSKYRKYFKQF